MKYHCRAFIFVPMLSLCLLAPAPAFAQAKKKKPAPVNRYNDAYEAMKKHRQEIVKAYVDSLFAIAEECASKALVEPGKKILDRILKVVEPPRNRRKVDAAQGVGLDEQGEREVARKEAVLAEVSRKALSPEEAARLKAITDRVNELRQKLESGSQKDEPAFEPDPPDSPGGPSGGSPTEAVPARKEKGKEKEAAPPGPRKKASEGELAIEGKEKRARLKLMKSVEQMANQCLKQGFPAHAYEILLWAIDLDPPNKGLRKCVNQYPFTDKLTGKEKWYSPYEMQKAKQGFLEHPEFGWVRPAEVKALQAGKLWYQNRWMPREQVEAERQKWENRWTHETEHYEIITNANLREAVQFGREVERLYSFFFRVFIDFYSVGKMDEDSKLVFGGGKDLGNTKLKLHYYRSREHYLAEIVKDPELRGGDDMELVARSAGFYFTGSKKAYFYRNVNGPDLRVIYHEVTHQIFGETYDPGVGAPTWMVEGFGVFLEDPVVRGERLLAGVEVPPGIKKSNFRDLNQFVKTLQTNETFHGGLRTDNYATAGASIHFFLFYKGGIYRQSFMRYAREAYRNTLPDSPTPTKKLYEYLKVSEEQLQRDWEAFNMEPDLFDF